VVVVVLVWATLIASVRSLSNELNSKYGGELNGGPDPDVEYSVRTSFWQLPSTGTSRWISRSCFE
jgi:hypothetical protein